MLRCRLRGPATREKDLPPSLSTLIQAFPGCLVKIHAFGLEGATGRDLGAGLLNRKRGFWGNSKIGSSLVEGGGRGEKPGGFHIV